MTRNTKGDFKMPSETKHTIHINWKRQEATIYMVKRQTTTIEISDLNGEKDNQTNL